MSKEKLLNRQVIIALKISLWFPKIFDLLQHTQAVEKAVNRGQLKQITGRGASGTFTLVDGAKKTGGKYEDAIEDAIIASNCPKDASIIALRNYLDDYHLEYRVTDRPIVLKKALDRAEAKGWIERARDHNVQSVAKYILKLRLV